MVSFSSMNFDNIGVPKVSASPSGLIADMYDKFQEKKNNLIAVTIANDTNRQERAGAALIGAVGGLLQFGALFGVYAIAKAFPKLNFPIVDRFITKNFDKWISRAQQIAPNKSKVHQIFLGSYAKALMAMASGAGLGFLCDLYVTSKNTVINGKISNTKSGDEGSWISSGLKSLSSSQQGKELIRNSIIKNEDDSITVKFNGIDKEYTITPKELKKASRSYVAYKDENGKVTEFKKKFSKGDGDVLAFELAYEKYCKEVITGQTQLDKNLYKTISTISDNGDVLYSNGSVNKLYYLLSGKQGNNFDIENSKNDNIDNIYSKLSINKFLKEASQNPEKFAADIRLKTSEGYTIPVRDKYFIIHELKTDKNYTIAKMDSKYATLVNSDKTKEAIVVPIRILKNHIASVNYLKTEE